MKDIEKYFEKISDTATSVAGVLIIILMVAQFVIVVLRYVFAVGASWGQDLLVYLFMLASILPLVLVVLQNHNVRVDIFYHRYTVTTKARLDRIGLLVLLLPVSAYTSYSSWGATLNSWQLLESSPTLGGLPGYFVLKTVQLLIFIGLAICACILASRDSPWDYSPSHSSEVR